MANTDPAQPEPAITGATSPAADAAPAAATAPLPAATGHGGFGGDDSPVGRPSTLGQPKKSYYRTVTRAAAIFVISVAALAGVLRIAGIHPSTDVSTGPNTTISAPAVPGTGGGVAPGSAATASPSATAPSTSNDTVITLTPEQGDSFDNGATTTEGVILTIANKGPGTLPAGKVYLYRGTDPSTKVTIATLVGQLNNSPTFAYGDDFASLDGNTVATFPAIPPGASAQLNLTYTFSGRSGQVTAVVSAPGMKVNDTSAPSTHEAAWTNPDAGLTTPAPSSTASQGLGN